jgi:hypothetical protein
MKEMRGNMFASIRLLPIVATATLFPVLAGCTAGVASDTPVDGKCDASRVQSLVGKPKPTDVVAMQQSGATIVRQIQSGQMVTQDYSEGRVTIETDSASGLVVRATCG